MRKADAEKKLRRLSDELAAHLKDYGPSETFISHDLLDWLCGAIADCQSGKLSMGQALGLEDRPWRPSAADAEAISPNIYKAWFIHTYDQRRQLRKKAAGTGSAPPKRLTWPKIAARVRFSGDPNDLRRQVSRHQNAIARMEAERFMKKTAKK